MVFYHGSAATDSLLIAIGSFQFNMNFETGYVTLAQGVAANLHIHESRKEGGFITGVQLHILFCKQLRAFNSKLILRLVTCL